MGRNIAIAALLALQFACAVFVLYDLGIGVLGLRVDPMSWALYEAFEVASALGLVLGAGLSAWALKTSRKARDVAESRLRLARGAFSDVLLERFDDWALTPAERDVALMCIKGFSTKEIAALRKTSEGTTKAQTAAIYRKAEVNGRAQLLSLFVDELMGDGLGVASAPSGDAGERPRSGAASGWHAIAPDARRAVRAALPARLETAERKPRRETRRTRLARERGETTQ